MIQESFAIGNSAIHQLDPRFRIGIASLFSVVMAISHGFSTLVLGLMVSVCLLLTARLDLGMVLRKLLLAGGFLALLWCLLPISVKGQPVFSIGFLKVTLPGIHLAAEISLKSVAILSVFIALIATMGISILGHGLLGLRLPKKLVRLLLLTYRYIFVIEQEYQRLTRAAKIRGFQAKTTLHTYKTYAYLIAILLVRSSLRAERVESAMRCRAFTGDFHCLYDFPVSVKNWIFAAAMGIVIFGLVTIEVLHPHWW